MGRRCSKCGEEGHYAPTCGRKSGAISVPGPFKAEILDNQGEPVKQMKGRRGWGPVTRVNLRLRNLWRAIHQDIRSYPYEFIEWKLDLIVRETENWDQEYPAEDVADARRAFNRWVEENCPRYPTRLAVLTIAKASAIK